MEERVGKEHFQIGFPFPVKSPPPHHFFSSLAYSLEQGGREALETLVEVAVGICPRSYLNTKHGLFHPKSEMW